MQITVLEPVKKNRFFLTGSKTVICIVLNQFSTKVENSFFSQRGMYTHYPIKHFGALTIFIDRAMIEFQKHQLINCDNTRWWCYCCCCWCGGGGGGGGGCVIIVIVIAVL